MSAAEPLVASAPEHRAGSALLEVRGLTVEFSTRHGAIAVVQDVDLAIQSGEIHAVVGESGSGKSVTALAIMGLLPQRTARVGHGEIRFRDRELTAMSAQQLRTIQGREMAMVFQEPMTSLNPAFTIGDQIGESVRFHLGKSRSEAQARVIELLDEVGIPQAARRYGSYPHEFSGGMRQRVMIAMALACEPTLLIADEPTTALDVTIQAQIVDLLRRLARDHGTAVMFITHDFGVVAEVADNVTVMYAAQVIEQADVYALFEDTSSPPTPKHCCMPCRHSMTTTTPTNTRCSAYHQHPATHHGAATSPPVVHTRFPTAALRTCHWLPSSRPVGSCAASGQTTSTSPDGPDS